MPTTPLDVLQRWDLTPVGPVPTTEDQRREGLVRDAAIAVSHYVSPGPEEVLQHAVLAKVTADLLVAIVRNCPPGPERSTAISHARAAKMWASAAVAMRRAGLARG